MDKENKYTEQELKLLKKIKLEQEYTTVKNRLWHNGIISPDIITEIKKKLPLGAIKYISINANVPYNKCVKVLNYKHNSIDMDSINIMKIALRIIIMEIDINK